MSAIGPGDWVVCIDARAVNGQPVPLEVGREYQVSAVWDYLPHLGTDDSWTDCAIDLVGVPDPAPGLSWGLYRFAPKRGSLDALLKATQPQRVNA